MKKLLIILFTLLLLTYARAQEPTYIFKSTSEMSAYLGAYQLGLVVDTGFFYRSPSAGLVVDYKKIYPSAFPNIFWVLQGSAGGTSMVDKIEDLEKLDGAAYKQVFVRDTLAGGTFTAYSSTGQIVDTAIVIRSSNPAYVYIRDMSQATAVDVRWWKPYIYTGTGANNGLTYWDSAFNRAVQYLSRKYNGGDIYIPKGNFLIRGPIFVMDNIHFHLDKNTYIRNNYIGVRPFFYGDIFCFGWFQQLDIADSSITTGVVNKKAHIHLIDEVPAGQRYVTLKSDTSLPRFKKGKIFFVVKGAYPYPSGLGTVDKVGEPSVARYCQLRKVDSVAPLTRRVYFTEAIEDSLWYKENRDSHYKIYLTDLTGGYNNAVPTWSSYIVQNSSIEGGTLESDSSGALACRPAAFACKFKDVLILNSIYMLGANGGHLCEWENVSGYSNRRMMEDAEGGDRNYYHDFWYAKGGRDISGGQASASGVTEEPVMTTQIGDIVENFYIDNTKSTEGVVVNARRGGIIRNGQIKGNFNTFVTVRGSNVTVDNVRITNYNDTSMNTMLRTASETRYGGPDDIEGNLDDSIAVQTRCQNIIISNCVFDTRIPDSIRPIGSFFMDNSKITNNNFITHNTGRPFFQINGQRNIVTGNYFDGDKENWRLIPTASTEPNFKPTDSINNNYYSYNLTRFSSAKKDSIDASGVGLPENPSFKSVNILNQTTIVATPTSGSTMWVNGGTFKIIGTNGLSGGFNFDAMTVSRNYSFPDISGFLLTANSTAAVSNKDFSSATNTFAIRDINIASNAAIANSKLANSAITINGTSVPLGGSVSVTGTAAAVPGAILAADQSSTGNTLTDVTGMTVPVVASSRYRLTIILSTEQTSGTGGVKFRLLGPTGSNFTGFLSGNSTTTVALMGSLVSGLVLGVQATNRYAGTGYAQIVGYVTTSTTAGNIQLQFSSNTAGESSVLHAGSGMDIVQLTAAP